jgi:Arc/MetJ family transcription regulator
VRPDPLGTLADGSTASAPRRPRGVYLKGSLIYTHQMTKRLIDVDDDALEAARAELGTRTIKDTVNEALRRVARQRSAELANALTVLAEADLDDRAAAWR